MFSSEAIPHLVELGELAARCATVLHKEIARATDMMRQTLDSGGVLYFCGNGGSAADAQHIATEYVVRFRRERRALAAVALTTDTSLITATANDYSFDRIFARQIEAICTKADLLVLHTTSGNSTNLIAAVEAAKLKGTRTLALSAKGGGKIQEIVDHCIVIPTNATDLAQELQLAIQHAICAAIDDGTT